MKEVRTFLLIVTILMSLAIVSADDYIPPMSAGDFEEYVESINETVPEPVPTSPVEQPVIEEPVEEQVETTNPEDELALVDDKGGTTEVINLKEERDQATFGLGNAFGYVLVGGGAAVLIGILFMMWLYKKKFDEEKKHMKGPIKPSSFFEEKKEEVKKTPHVVNDEKLKPVREYVKKLRSLNYDDEMIYETLMNAGWPSEYAIEGMK